MKLHRRSFLRSALRSSTFAGVLSASVAAGCLEVAVIGTVTQSTAATTAGDDAAVIAALVLLGVIVIAGVTVIVEEDVSLYLDENRRDIERAIARGDGPFVRDLAHALGVPAARMSHLGDVLRRSRLALAAGLGGPAGPPPPGRARAFAQALVESLAADVELGAMVHPDHLLERARALGLR